MASVAIFKPGKIPQYLQSVNTVDYCDIPEELRHYNADRTRWGVSLSKDEILAYVKAEVVINPDISNLLAVPHKYWKRSDNKVLEMSAAEKQAVDAAELQERKDQANKFDVGLDDVMTALIKVVNTRLPAGQKITKEELITAVKEEVK